MKENNWLCTEFLQCIISRANLKNHDISVGDCKYYLSQPENAIFTILFKSHKYIKNYDNPTSNMVRNAKYSI